MQPDERFIVRLGQVVHYLIHYYVFFFCSALVALPFLNLIFRSKMSLSDSGSLIMSIPCNVGRSGVSNESSAFP